MPLSREQAEGALRDITQTERRSFSAYGYKSAAPYLLLWGALWIVGYGATDPDAAYLRRGLGRHHHPRHHRQHAFFGMRGGGARRPFSWRIFLQLACGDLFPVPRS